MVIQSLRPSGFTTAFGRAEPTHADCVVMNGAPGVRGDPYEGNSVATPFGFAPAWHFVEPSATPRCLCWCSLLHRGAYAECSLSNFVQQICLDLVFGANGSDGRGGDCGGGRVAREDSAG